MVRFKEPFNGISHLLGAIAAIVVTILFLHATRQDPAPVGAAFAVYGASMIVLYSASAWYHLLDVSPRVHRALRTLDHVSISLLIAGTYTPLCLVALHGRTGTALFWAVWGLAAAVILTDVFWLEAPRVLKTILYVLLGWVAIWAMAPLQRAVGWGGLAWLLGGGVVYSAGSVLYAIKKPDPLPGIFGFHEIWHLFVLAGSACFVILMWRYVLPLAAVMSSAAR